MAAPVVDLSAHFEGCREELAFGVDTDGAIYAVGSTSDEDLMEWHPSGAGFPKSRLKTPSRLKVLRRASDGAVSTVALEDDVVVHFVEPYREGVLLVGGRCRWTPERVEQNALAVDWRGQELARFVLGDGIADVRVTPDRKTIWASYFDEGVFGNYGWHGPGPPTIGALGLVAFSMEGDAQRHFDAEAAGTDSICDAYAMNLVSDEEVWVYYYTEFPLVRVRGEEYRTWSLGIGGARALAIDGARALLFGDYRERDLARVIELGDDGVARVVDERTLTDEHGVSLEGAPCRGVGSTLYFLQGRRVLALAGW